MTSITIVMYHYVRPLAGSAYPNIRGLELASFERQLDYLTRYYQPVSMEQVVAALDGQVELPRNSVLLTFDDGYSEHFMHVAPALDRRAIKGAFFPPARAILNREILAVNKLHFVLASDVEPSQLVADLERACEECQPESGIPVLAELREAHARVRPYETIEVSYLKNVLQKVLPTSVRESLVGRWFSEHVTVDELGFADDLYVTLDQLKRMSENGHHIGAHGDGHYRLDTLSRDQQWVDIASSVALLDRVGMPSDCRTMCYPYGAYNADTISILDAMAFRAALTTQTGLTEVSSSGRFSLARLDTNEFPTSSDAPPCGWTVTAVG